MTMAIKFSDITLINYQYAMKKHRIVHFLGLLFIITCFNLQEVLAQNNLFKYKASIKDSITQAPLKNVQIFRYYTGDTISMVSTDGKFEIPVGIGAKIHFRKKGYAWHSVKITSKNIQDIFLTKSKSHQKDIGLENYANTEIIYDGEVVSQEDWDDVGSINHDEIATLEIYNKNGKNKIVFLSKP